MPKLTQTKNWTDEQREANRARSREYQRKRRAECPGKAQQDRDYAKLRGKRIMADPILVEQKRTYERELRAKRVARDPSFKRTERDKAYRNRYGIDFSQREAMLEEQGGCCRLCRLPVEFGKASKSGGAHLDHCHQTGRVRSVLCGKCNMSMGFFGDDPVQLRRAAEYLETHRKLAEVAP